MRVGDFSVEVVAAGGGDVRELESGHVLARPGQVYTLRLRNHGPLRCVVDVELDGRGVTAGGLVLDPWSSVDLERPIHASERGRFTVVGEGDERVFGPDGGRDNPDLGLIEARFRRELTGRGRPEPMPVPASSRPPFPMPPVPVPATPAPAGPFPRRPLAPPEWTPPGWNGPLADIGESLGAGGFPAVSSILTPAAPVVAPGTPRELPDALERAAGTGLTGSSAQEFVPIHLGPLEAEATVIKLRLVIGTEAAIAAPRPLPEPEGAPARPAARP